MSSGRVNIGTSNKDKHYRYTREKLQVKVEGRGNGIKTVLTNIVMVARALHVPPMYPTKFFGCELSTHSSYDTKNDKYILNGKFDQATLEKSLDDFIARFVICKNCGIPEADLSVDKNEMIHMNCKACGHMCTVPPSEKLYTYIVKHPPPKQKVMKSQAQKNQAEAMAQMAKKSASPEEEEEEETWETDVSEEAVRKRREKEGLSSKILEMTADSEEEEDEEDEEQSPVEVLRHIIEIKSDASDDFFIKGIKKIKKEYGMDKRDCVCLAFEAFLANDDIVEQIAKRKNIFLNLLADLKSTETGQRIILGYLEELVGAKKKDLLPKTSDILQAFFDSDILTEDVIMAWHEKKKSKYVNEETAKIVRKNASNFVEMLKTASDEE